MGGWETGASHQEPFDPQLCSHQALLCLSFPNPLEGSEPHPKSPVGWGRERKVPPSRLRLHLSIPPHGVVTGMSPVPHGHLALAGAGSDPAELSIPRPAGARWDLFPRYIKSSPSTKLGCLKSKPICVFMPDRALPARGINRTQRNQGFFFTKLIFLYQKVIFLSI